MLAHIYLGLTWFLFGFIHSLTAATGFKQRLMSWSDWVTRYYRLLYNGLSLLTFGLVWLAYRKAPVQIVSVWTGAAGTGIALIGLGLLLGIVALAGYDLAEFSGFPPRQPDTKSNSLRQDGLLRYVRHPLYLATLVILIGLLVREPSWRTFLFSGFAFIYMRIGIYYEERKLVRVFGQPYRDYQRNVPMLMPFTIRRN
ncbi:methyltransferase family protein [Spirosoma aerophilum]